MTTYVLENARVTMNPVRSLDYDDVFYAGEDGIAEKQYVFLQGNNLRQRWTTTNSRKFRFTIVEAGFGMGLNFLLTMKLWHALALQDWHLSFISIENKPLAINDLKMLLPNELAGRDQLIRHYPPPIRGYHEINFSKQCRLTVIQDDVETALSSLRCSADAWFLDGFSPAKNPEMWTPQVVREIAARSKPGTSLATYSASGAFRRALAQAGFKVTRKPGFAGKRHMLTARFEKAGRPTIKDEAGEVVVLGGGLAGSLIARSLADRHYQVRIFDANVPIRTPVLQMALYPGLAGKPDRNSLLILQAYLYGEKFLTELSATAGLKWHNTGLLQLLQEKHVIKRCKSLVQELGSIPEILTVISQDGQDQLFYPKSGWLNPADLINVLQLHPRVELIEAQVHSLSFNQSFDKRWSGRGRNGKTLFNSPLVIVAAGYQSQHLLSGAHLTLRPNRGQTCQLQTNSDLAKIKAVLCGPVTLFPRQHQTHTLAATYGPGSEDLRINHEQSRELSARLTRSIPALRLPLPTQPRVGIRCGTRDRMPVVGAIPDWHALADHCQPLTRGAPIPEGAFRAFQDGLYVMTGLGSHGLSMGPLCAEYLARQINAEPSNISNTSAQIMSPLRFVFRDARKGLPVRPDQQLS